ncbi:MAG: acyl carrier protein [Planctomycetaceae bacterium]|nr:acyl carrier protein [Planctomycetaceae bacterium]
MRLALEFGEVLGIRPVGGRARRLARLTPLVASRPGQQVVRATSSEVPEALTDQTPLITGGILDSISTLKLVVFLEERFGVTVEAHEAGVEHLDTVGEIARLITEKKHAA